MVWRETTQIGCGLSSSTDKRTLITICYYYPSGNQHGKERSNIFNKLDYYN
jgi:hypothetical protein